MKAEKKEQDALKIKVDPNNAVPTKKPIDKTITH
jgi:hypothetical protein